MPVAPIARYYEEQTWDAVQCVLCPHHCSIAPSRQGTCGVRVNRNGILYTLTYGRVAESSPMTIEDVPLFHFHPGSRWLRVGSIGCTMHCPFCSTWKYSQVGGVRTRHMSPEAPVEEALKAEAVGIAFMTNEPAVWHEYLIDVSQAARKNGLHVAATTGAMWSTEPFAEAARALDALLFGFKGFETGFWSVECGGALEQARLNFEAAVDQLRHVEVSYLVIEGVTDSTEQVDAFSHWLSEVQSHTPVHVIGYKPDFHWDRPATSADCLRKVADLLGKRLPFVYGEEGLAGLSHDTRCPSCSRVVIARSTVRGTALSGLRDDVCTGCGARLPIVGTARKPTAKD